MIPFSKPAGSHGVARTRHRGIIRSWNRSPESRPHVVPTPPWPARGPRRVAARPTTAPANEPRSCGSGSKVTRRIEARRTWTTRNRRSWATRTRPRTGRTRPRCSCRSTHGCWSYSRCTTPARRDPWQRTAPPRERRRWTGPRHRHPDGTHSPPRMGWGAAHEQRAARSSPSQRRRSPTALDSQPPRTGDANANPDRSGSSFAGSRHHSHPSAHPRGNPSPA